MGMSDKPPSNEIDFSGCDLLSQKGHGDDCHDGDNTQYRHQLQ
jgi:hypothetical protein